MNIMNVLLVANNICWGVTKLKRRWVQEGVGRGVQLQRYFPFFYAGNHDWTIRPRTIRPRTIRPGNYSRNIYIADKSVKFSRDVHFGLLIKKKMALREIQTLSLAGAIKRGRKGGGEEYIVCKQLSIQ